MFALFNQILIICWPLCWCSALRKPFSPRKWAFNWVIRFARQIRRTIDVIGTIKSHHRQRVMKVRWMPFSWMFLRSHSCRHLHVYVLLQFFSLRPFSVVGRGRVPLPFSVHISKWNNTRKRDRGKRRNTIAHYFNPPNRKSASRWNSALRTASAKIVWIRQCARRRGNVTMKIRSL